jgi:hypothetical protein
MTSVTPTAMIAACPMLRMDRVLARLEHATPVDEAPLRHRQRPGRVGGDRQERGRREAPVVEPPQHQAHEQDLEHGRRDLEDQVVDEVLHRVDAALDRPRQAARLAVEVEAQAQPVQVAERLQREAVDAMLRHRVEDHGAQLLHGRGQDARRAIGEDEPDRQRDRRVARAERVDRLLVEDRDEERRRLRAQQQGKGQEDPHPERQPLLAPEIGREVGDDRERGRRLPGRAGRSGHGCTLGGGRLQARPAQNRFGRRLHEPPGDADDRTP